MEQTPSNNKNLIVILASIAALGVVGGLAYNYYANPKFKVKTNEQVVVKNETTTKQPEDKMFKNGTYTKTGSYQSPGGPEEIEVTLVITDNTVTGATVTKKATLPLSIKFQTQFEEGFKEYVVGKKVTEIKLDKVAGSSLTPKGFNDALEQIKTAAQS